jgi:hypothetical protein
MQQGNLVKKGQFYFIFDTNSQFVLEDKTKRGLEARERVMDVKYGVEVDRGMIHDTDGIGHKMGIRWYFPKSKYSLDQVVNLAKEIESRYRAIRDMTCPDDE